jgi:heterotetrameric sarcosine oxidase gamma subunit
LAEAARRAGGGAAVVADVSDRDVAFELAGPEAAACLNAFCALDLDAATFPEGACARTVLGKAPVLLWRTGAEAFHVETARSLGPYVIGCLEEARLEFLD